jgi:glutamate synthase (NADPH/NADH) small chain
MAGVFAGGDIVTGAATVIQAMGAGRRAACAMKAWLGLRDVNESALSAAGDSGERPFGLPLRERGYARLQLV